MGTKSKKKAKTRLDAYYRLAKDQGYRARSAFKLIQLNRKYDFLAKSRVLVDLCAAPGGWLQVAAKHMPIGSKIVGVDLAPIAPIRGCKTFVGDITDDKTRKTIVTWLKKEPVDCVIHDGAPNVGGVWSRDLFEQNALVLCAAKMATQLLKAGGWFVTKVFRSPDFQKLMWVMKQLFDKVEATKPLASRMESAEIFVVCAGFKNPKHIDPKLFHAQSVFADVQEEKIVSASGMLVTPKTNVPQGYDEFATITHHVATLREFLDCKDPKAFLKMNHEIRFPESDRGHLSSKHSKKELIYLCQDLQQVGEADRRRLIRWREQLLREEAKVAKATRAEDFGDEDDIEGMQVSGDEDGDASSTGGDAGDADEEGATGEDDVTTMARQLLEIRKRDIKEQKKKQKKLVDRKLKQVKGLINYDPTQSAEHYTETDGFGTGNSEMGPLGSDDEPMETEVEGLGTMTIANVAAISEDRLAQLMDKHWEEAEGRTDNAPLNPVVSANLEEDDDVDLGSAEEAEEGEEDDAEEEDNRPLMINNSMQIVEGDEDSYDVDYYGNYVKAERSNRVKIFEEGFENPAEEEEDYGEGADGAPLSKEDYKKQKKAEKDEKDLEEAGKQSKWQRRHLNIDKVLRATFPKPKQERKKRSSKLVDEDVVELKAKGPLVADGITAKPGAKKREKMRYDANASSDDEVDDDDSDGSDDYEASDVSSLEAHLSDDEVLAINEGRKDSRRKKLIVPDVGKLTAMELVKQQRKQTMKDNRELRKNKKANTKSKKNKKNDTEFEEIPLAMTDPDIRARTLALATKMLDKRNRRDILDASINKFMHNDDDDLPDWFVKDEQRNCKVMLPITAAEVEAERQRFAELNARPSRKVMEALGRKRRKAQRMLRGILEKGKSDPRARQKANGLSVRKLMRAQVIKGGDMNKKKNKPLDPKSMGERKRQRQALKRQGRGGGGKKRR